MSDTPTSSNIVATEARSLFVLGTAALPDADTTAEWVSFAKLRDGIATRKPTTWRPDQALILGRMAQGGKANSNGHEFDPTDIVANHASMVTTGLNIGHVKPDLVGHFVATNLVTGDEATALGGPNYFDAAGVYLTRNRPDRWPDVARALTDKRLFYSMECVGRTITCMDHCGETFPYRGPTDPTYCEALQRIGPRARINDPFFTGGALVIPPKRPGWQHAAIDTVVASHTEDAEAVYEAIAELAPHLDAGAWEQAMATVMLEAFPTEAAAAVPRRLHTVAFDPLALDLIDQAHLHDHDRVEVAAMIGADPAPTVAKVEDGTPANGKVGAVIVAEPDDDARNELAAHLLVTQPASDIHCTLAYMGKADVDQSESDIGRFTIDGIPARRVEAIAASIAALIPPLAGTISGVVRWDEGDDGSTVDVALLDVPALAEAREMLVDALGRDGIPVATNHGFTAHITLRQDPPGADVVTIESYDNLKGVVVQLPRWAVWWGKLRRASYETGVGIDR